MKYAVFGAGMQGTACAYDIAVHGNAEQIIIADFDLDKAAASALRVNTLTGSKSLCVPAKADANNSAEVIAVMKNIDTAVSAVPYHYHQLLFEPALQTNTNLVHMGDDTVVTLQLLEKDDIAKKADITFVPDCGLAPGLVNSLALYCMEYLDKTDEIRLYCGGLPQNPKPPLNYRLVFSVEGLVGEYVDTAVILRNGKVEELDTLEELEQVEFEQPFGALEAFTTSSGTSTAPYTFQNKIQTYEYKTLRYPGHCDIMKTFRKYGFWDETPITVDGKPVIPLHLFYELMGDKLQDPTDKDVVITRCAAIGNKDSNKIQMTIDIIDYHDNATGFSAMERLTGFSTAIIAIETAKGNVRKGCVPYETAVSGKAFVDNLKLRGFNLTQALEVINF